MDALSTELLLIDALDLAARMDSAATDVACGQLPAGGHAAINSAATHLRLLVAEALRLHALLAKAAQPSNP